jgi:hypothetical protein
MPEKDDKLTFTIRVTNPENNTENSLSIVEYTPVKGKGKEKAKLQPSDLETWDLKKAIDTFGATAVWKKLAKPRLKQLISVFTDEACTKDDGETPETDPSVIANDYGDMFGKLSLRGETIQALDRRYYEIAEIELPEALDALPDDPTNPEFAARYKAAKELRDELKQVQADRQAKKAERKPRTAKPEESSAPVQVAA